MLGEMDPSAVRSGPSRGGWRILLRFFRFCGTNLVPGLGCRSFGFLIRNLGTHRQHAALSPVGQAATSNRDRGTDTLLFATPLLV